jgi:hypothetical protein
MVKPRILLAAAATTAVLVVSSAAVVLDSGATTAPEARAEPLGAATMPAATPAATTVTIADLEAAQAAVRQCLQDAGYDVVVVLPGEGLRRTQYTFTGDVRDADAIHTANAVQADCRARYSDALTLAWGKQQEPPTAAQLEELHDRVLACVADGGVQRLTDAIKGTGTAAGYPAFVGFALDNNPPGLLMDIPHDQLDVYAGCALQMEAETGLSAPLPWPSYFDDIKSGHFAP